MAQKRMFSMKIIDSDAFLDMPLSTQALYFHLSMRADDDGFIGNHKRIMRTIGSGNDELKLLLTKNFIIPFESGVCVIKHWKMHNYIQKDRYHPTSYIEEKAQLKVKENNAYTLGNDMDTKCIQNDSSVLGLDLELDSVLVLEEEKDMSIPDKPKKIDIYKKEYFTNKDVNDIFIDFLKQRKKLKAINSDRAIKTLLNKLNKFSDEDKIMLIDKSIVGSWKDIYTNSYNNNTPQSNYDDDSLDKALGINKYEKYGA